MVEATNDYIDYNDYVRYIPVQVLGVLVATWLKNTWLSFSQVREGLRVPKGVVTEVLTVSVRCAHECVAK